MKKTLVSSIWLAARAMPTMSVICRLPSWRISGLTSPSRTPAANRDTSCNRVPGVITAPAPAGVPEADGGRVGERLRDPRLRLGEVERFLQERTWHRAGAGWPWVGVQVRRAAAQSARARRLGHAGDEGPRAPRWERRVLRVARPYRRGPRAPEPPRRMHISGLYAGGGTAIGVSGSGYKGYSSGNGLLAAAMLGKVAGEAASEEIIKDSPA